jgi:leader peptidase (prepilin peptidase)/N-methyltransferase
MQERNRIKVIGEFQKDDPKLAAMIGAWLGWKLLLVASFLACGIGAIAGGLAMALGWIGRRQAIPFGPFLALGALLSMFWGSDLMALYLRLMAP